MGTTQIQDRAYQKEIESEEDTACSILYWNSLDLSNKDCRDINLWKVYQESRSWNPGHILVTVSLSHAGSKGLLMNSLFKGAEDRIVHIKHQEIDSLKDNG